MDGASAAWCGARTPPTLFAVCHTRAPGRLLSHHVWHLPPTPPGGLLPHVRCDRTHALTCAAPDAALFLPTADSSSSPNCSLC